MDRPAAGTQSALPTPSGLLTLSPVAATHDGVRIRFRVQPRASRTELAGLHGTEIRVRLRAPPVDGAANDALIRFVAERLAVPRARVAIVAGAASRSKVVSVEGVGVADAVAALVAPER